MTPATKRYHVTLWPGVVPLPTLDRYERYWLNEQGTAIVARTHRASVDSRARVGEVYLRLAALDLDDPEQIIRFAQVYGTPAGASIVDKLEHALAFTSSFSAEEDGAILRSLLPTDPALRLLTNVITLESFRFAARCFRDLIAASRLVRGDTFDHASHPWELAVRGEGTPGESSYRPELIALVILTTGLTELLRHVRPVIFPTPTPYELDGEDLPPLPPSARGAEIEIPTQRNSTELAEFCALELFNHIAENATYRSCENENCKLPFVRQYGRSEHGQSKLQGVKFCSAACARAEAQRKYRRRRQAKRTSA